MTKQDILSQSIYRWQKRNDGTKDETAFFMKSRASWSLYWEGMPKVTSEKPMFALLDEYNRPVIALYVTPDEPDYRLMYLTAPARQPLRLTAPAPAPNKRHDLLLMCEPDRALLIFDGALIDEVKPAGEIESNLYCASIHPESGTRTIAMWDYAFIEKEYSILCGTKKKRR